MLIIKGKLVSDDVIKKQFLCNLKACKGACCWEGDFGAPLEKNEIEIEKKIFVGLFQNEYEKMSDNEKTEFIAKLANNGLDGNQIKSLTNQAHIYFLFSPFFLVLILLLFSWEVQFLVFLLH